MSLVKYTKVYSSEFYVQVAPDYKLDHLNECLS